MPKWVQLGFLYRGKAEFQHGIDFIRGIDDHFYLSRLRLEATLKPKSWFQFHAQAQDAQALAYRSEVRPDCYHNPLDLRQLYVEVGDIEQQKISFRLGRQELRYGSERLVGTTDWTNADRTFDAARVALDFWGNRVDVFAAQPVKAVAGRFDKRYPGENFYGAYGAIDRTGGKVIVEPYFLWRALSRVYNDHGGLGYSNVLTSGARVWGHWTPRLDYNAEIAVQRGSHAKDAIRGLGGSYTVGWIVKDSPLKPRLSFEYSHASGDDKAHDGVRRTFDNLYGSNHDYYGITDQIAWRNIRNPRVGFDFHATHKIHVNTEYHEFFLATVKDGLYNYLRERTVINPSAKSSHVGREWNIQFH